MNEHIYTVDEIKALAAPIARRYGVKALYLFGSYARGEATPLSDLDFRVERGKLRSLLELGGLYSDLEECFGKKLDIVTTQGLSPAFLDSISAEEIIVYNKV